MNRRHQIYLEIHAYFFNSVFPFLIYNGFVCFSLLGFLVFCGVTFLIKSGGFSSSFVEHATRKKKFWIFYVHKI